jgi:hypothetical protein
LRYQLEAVDKVTASASPDVIDSARDDLRQARAVVGAIAADLAAAEARLGDGRRRLGPPDDDDT